MDIPDFTVVAYIRHVHVRHRHTTPPPPHGDDYFTVRRRRHYRRRQLCLERCFFRTINVVIPVIDLSRDAHVDISISERYDSNRRACTTKFRETRIPFLWLVSNIEYRLVEFRFIATLFIQSRNKLITSY